MSTDSSTDTPGTPFPDPEQAAEAARKKKKKDEKVRSAWIAFVGRIVAQIVGAVVSIALAIFFLQRAQSGATLPAAPVSEAVVKPAARSARTDGRITLAVLPLSNYSGDPRQDYFADGMTEALITDLAQLDGLRVISRTSVMQYRNQQKPLRQVAAELGADMIVEGSVVRAGDRVRVTAQLIDASSDHHLWAHSYEHTMRDVFALQGLVASAIAKEVRGALTPLQQGLLAARRAVDPAVYELYLRGRHAWNLRTAAGFDAAISFFEQAIEQDPTFALAYAGLADAYLLPSPGETADGASTARAKSLAAATRALELDPRLAEAHTSRAGLYQFHERNRTAAETEFQRALELNPGYPTARQWYAILLSELGRDAEALTHAREAVALDPLSGTMHQALGLVHYYGRRFGEAATELRRAIELTPQLPLARTILPKALFQLGAHGEAIKLIQSTPEPHSADLQTILGLSYLRSGDTARANAMLTQLKAQRPLPVVSLAQWYAVAGDPEAALDLLNRGDSRTLIPTAIAVDPLFDGVRADARFTALVSRGRL